MKIFMLLFVVTLTTADDYCKGIYIDDKYYNVEVLKEGLTRIHQIAFHDNENTLYFTFDQIATVPTRQLGYINIATKKVGIVDGIRNATGVAYDRTKQRLYVGGSDGLFFISDMNKVPERLPVVENIKYLHFKDVLYIINNKRQGFKFENGLAVPLMELQNVHADALVVDDADSMLYLDNETLYRVQLGTRIINIHEGYSVNSIATDRFYKPYVCAKTGLFAYNKFKFALDKKSDKLSNLKALSFTSKNEPIYVVNGHIVRFINNPVPCFGD